MPAEYAAGVYDDLMSAGGRPRHPPGRPVRPCRACGWRRATATWASTSTTPTTRSRPGSASPSPGTSRAGSSAGTRCSARARGPAAAHRVVGLIVDDPAADLFGNEPVLLRRRLGRLRPRRRLRLHRRRPGRARPGGLRRTASPASGSSRATSGSAPTSGTARPAADRAVLRPAAAAHPGPLRGRGVAWPMVSSPGWSSRRRRTGGAARRRWAARWSPTRCASPTRPRRAAAEHESNWRSGYLVHFRRLIEAGLASKAAGWRSPAPGWTRCMRGCGSHPRAGTRPASARC